jgi:peptidoglycan hydrolase-like protein with peptidoglycan-binding domain
LHAAAAPNILPCSLRIACRKGLRKGKLKHWNKKTCAARVLLGALVWILPVQLPADTTTPQKSTSTAKRKSPTPSTRNTHKASARTGQHRSARHPATRHVSSKARRAAVARHRRAQLRLEPERIQEIQQALVQAGYLNAQPNGLWDDQTREAMRRYQAEHGFLTTGLPEAKSLMKLGLGPHPLPADVDSSSGARAGADAVSNTASPPNTPPSPPTTAPQP